MRKEWTTNILFWILRLPEWDMLTIADLYDPNVEQNNQDFEPTDLSILLKSHNVS